MRLLDEQYLQTPFYGYRKMQLVLAQAGYLVNHKRVRKLMQLVGIETIYGWQLEAGLEAYRSSGPV